MKIHATRRIWNTLRLAACVVVAVSMAQLDANSSWGQSSTPSKNNRYEISGSDIIGYLTHVVSKDPHLSLSEVIKQANIQLEQRGINFEAVLRNEKSENNHVILETEVGTVLLDFHPFDSDGCGQNFAPYIPVKRFKEKKIELAYGAQSLIFTVPKELDFQKVFVLDQKTGDIISEIRTRGPGGGNPYRVSAAGMSVFWRVMLEPEADSWWINVQARHPILQKHKKPFLSFRISEESMEFIEDPRLMVNAADKKVLRDPPKEMKKGMGDWEFRSKGFRVLFTVVCT